MFDLLKCLKEWSGMANRKKLAAILILLAILFFAAILILRKGASPNDASPNIENTETNDFTEIFDSREDGFLLLGEKYSEADRRFGTYENVVSENTRYYPSCGVSILYNAGTGIILYVDNDGTGTGEKNVPVFGILPGDSMAHARSHLIENGMTVIDVSADTFNCQFAPSDDENVIYEIEVVFSENEVKLVSAKLKNI